MAYLDPFQAFNLWQVMQQELFSIFCKRARQLSHLVQHSQRSTNPMATHLFGIQCITGMQPLCVAHELLQLRKLL